ncbi:unnamed protein product [Blepharisma stoltei]|uniref:Uncharacterized protein n=1 Tax=Blepharisma stoltei TaxID=1481888 RepID=A0AAU9K4M9_9CILI|nr:unnamed protein product [Blepharisma stoltei]
MTANIHFYKLLEEVHENIQIKLPETIIIGFGFEEPTFMWNFENDHLSFEVVSKEDILHIISRWSAKDSLPIAIVKTDAKKHWCETTDEIAKFLNEECVIQQVIKHHSSFPNIRITWDFQKGYTMATDNSTSVPKISRSEPSLSTNFTEINKDFTSKNREFLCPTKLRRVTDSVKNILNRKLKNISCRIEHLEIDFLKSAANEHFLLGIHQYTYSACKSLQRFANTRNTSFYKPPLSPTFKTALSPTPEPTQKILTKKNDILGAISYSGSPHVESIDDEIQELVSPKGNYKFMRYGYWKNKFQSGEKMLPNEIQYAKNIAKHSTRILIETSKNLTEVKGMVKKLRGSIDTSSKHGLFHEKLKLEITDHILRERDRARTRLEEQIWKKKSHKNLPLIIENTAANNINYYAELIDQHIMRNTQRNSLKKL